MSRVGEDKIAEVRARANIVEIISRYTALKRTGRRHAGLCPFHNEKTASFSVSEERGLFYCFGCHASGDVFKFLMLREQISFPEALERLAKEVGVELPKRPDELRRDEGRARLLRVNAFAARFFQQQLWESPAGAGARTYLAGRAIREETARAFGLGFAPPEGLAQALEAAKAPLEDAETLGLVARSQRGGGWYDRFRNRLIFPISDLGGKIVAFGGRILEAVEGGPKYLNSSESALFQKRRSLFGLEAARDAIHRENRVVVVEGYIDAIMLWQAGIQNVVAPLGTALTTEQLRLLKRFTEAIVVFFDGDRAGAAAAARSFPVFAEVGSFADAAFLPAGHDPDSFVRSEGKEGVERILAAKTPLVDHYLRSLAPGDAALAARLRGAQEVAELLARVDGPIFKGLLARRAGEFFGLAEQELLGRARPSRITPPPSPAAPSAVRPPALSSHESLIVELLLVAPVLAEALPAAVDSFFEHEEALAILERIRAGGRSLDASEILPELSTEARDRVARSLLGEADIYVEPSRMLADCLAKLANEAHERALRALSQKIRAAEQRGDGAALAELLAQKQRLAAAGPRPGVAGA